ncbi:MAG TPA: NUDIX hydrolase, partial [Sarcina sp.]|nr:NUDIX hydrolase [Sarcina sp.]
DNYAFLFTAKNCRRVSGQILDDMEFLDVKKYSAREMEELIAKGEFQQAVHIT